MRSHISGNTNIFVSCIALGLLLIFQNMVLAQEVATVDAIAKWLSINAIPLGRADADGLADLQPLKKLFRGVQVVGLGEATHSTHEFFEFKSRSFKFLIKEMNFRVLALETGYAATVEIDEYVQGKSNDVEKALRDQGFWPFDTKEMRNLLDWLRAHNRKMPPVKKVKVVGFDIHYNNRGKQKILSYLKRVAPERAGDAESLFKMNLEILLETAFFTRNEHERSDILTKLAEARTRYNELLGFLVVNEVRFSKQTSVAQFTEVREYARVLTQLADSSAQPLAEADGPLRDYYMAENIKRLVEAEEPGTRIVVWAHNQHISAGRESEKYPYMGFHLRQFFGDAYYAIGFSFNEGSFQARDYSPNSSRELRQFTIGSAPEGSVDWYLARVGFKSYFLDLRHSLKDKVVEQWLRTSRPMRGIGSYYNAQLEKNYFLPTTLKQEFDGIVFFAKSTPAHPNASKLRFSESTLIRNANEN